jgi:2-C-methyl-D-erythritol 4-phosphate cytidylyltransferase
MNVAILTAGGTGTRMNNNVPKQFLTVNDIPIIVYTLRKFQNNKNIDKIAIACLKGWQQVMHSYKLEFGIDKLRWIVEGGATNLGSIENCLKAIGEIGEDDNIIIHDGNRPLVSSKIIDDNLKNCSRSHGTTTIIDINDGVLIVDKNHNIIDNSVSRDNIKRTQTPHCFKFGMIEEIFNKIDDKNKYISVADAATKMGYDLKLVSGSDLNFKITTLDDLTHFKLMIDLWGKDV